MLNNKFKKLKNAGNTAGLKISAVQPEQHSRRTILLMAYVAVRIALLTF